MPLRSCNVISKTLYEDLGKALKAVPEKGWTTFDQEGDGTLRQWAEVDFVPGEQVEKKDLLAALRCGWPDGTLRNANAKRLRFTIIHVTGRFSRDRRKITLRLAATIEWIKRPIKLVARFPLPTQPTG